MNRPDKLSLVSYLAPNLFWFYSEVGAYLGRVLGIETQLEQSQCDPLADPILQHDQLDLAFICGLPFVQYQRVTPTQLEALVAPVMQSERYQNRPVYFSEVIVKADSNFKTFNDLLGKTLCFNDPGSNSGYNLLRHRLIQGKYPSRFFNKVIQSGSHQRSIQLVIEGLADCSAIDSTVLEEELRNSPELAKCLRVADSIGPCPMPPVVVAQHLGPELIDCLQSLLLQPDPQLQAAMVKAQIRRYDLVQSQDYEPLGDLYDAALEAGYTTIG
ncbi:ABC transporter, substrate-binding protein (cluster 12, methionine/phosphonates) [uncultured Synechococcales cyanobacterium]|uniref:ABC transporter, substrate-binding protein (Cluster 12, methionine/phosphonates) n=1 Tax=uncultured Synechococcales cyanobacterium TaxID=1936017 RepID=A0A6J4VVM4_9CYAN|nr:ABC transporter, substrate-binding protein (cluster 12, methionine/phosphonates) [uncultured Synechococcales cyanobacterium]